MDLKQGKPSGVHALFDLYTWGGWLQYASFWFVDRFIHRAWQNMWWALAIGMMYMMNDNNIGIPKIFCENSE